MDACLHPKQQNQGRGQNQNNKDKGKKQTVQVKQGRLNFTTMVGIPEGATVMTGTFCLSMANLLRFCLILVLHIVL
jgi:hypothetical protein